MSISSRLGGWLRRLKPQKAPEPPSGLLREFVYLDEVSVYSILASRKGGIATEFTESQTASLNSDVGGFNQRWARRDQGQDRLQDASQPRFKALRYSAKPSFKPASRSCMTLSGIRWPLAYLTPIRYQQSLRSLTLIGDEINSPMAVGLWTRVLFVVENS